MRRYLEPVLLLLAPRLIAFTWWRDKVAVDGMQVRNTD